MQFLFMFFCFIQLNFFIMFIVLCFTVNDWGKVMLYNRGLMHYLDFVLNNDGDSDVMVMDRDHTVSNLFSNSMGRVQMELLMVDIRV